MGRVCSHCTNRMKENRKCNKDIILHINNNKCVEPPSKGWLEYCLGIFTKKKEDNSDNVTIIIFVAKLIHCLLTGQGRKPTSVFHLRGMFLIAFDRVSLSFAASHMFLRETLNSTPLFPMP